MMNLADPELELIDPTPNVHSMFLHFDETFFWTQLSSRCAVRWSKRMYSSAGTCSYGSGFCDIALSEPLLKLRPRKDLVETLLHEMIHAYLFVMKKDQDRNGHGPNFQAHMHRINRVAGLNISIYHDFHDEVKLYRTHWWRCNGLCQLMKPYFGIVRRINNRPPGPKDYWWKNHQRNCGGIFIKIKEPDVPDKKSKKANVGKPKADITKYINSNNNNNNKEVNITQNEKCKTSVLKDFSNIIVKPKIGIKSNANSTLVVTKKNVIFSPQTPKPVAFTGTGLKIGGTQQPNNRECKNTSSADVLETVRNVWSNKHIGLINAKESPKSNNSVIVPSLNKHKPDNYSKTPSPKVKKIDDYFKTAATSVLKNVYGQDFHITQSKEDQKLKAIPKKDNFIDCPVCNSKVNTDEINRHLDECLNKTVIETLSNECIPVSQKEYSVNVKHAGGETELKQTILNVTKNRKRSSSFIHEKVTNNSTFHPVDTGLAIGASRKRSRTSIDEGDLRTTGQVVGAIDKKNSKVRKSDSFKEPTSLNTVKNIGVDITSSMEINPPIKLEPGCSKSDTNLGPVCPCCGDKLNTSVDEHLDECFSFFKSSDTIPEEGASTSFMNETIDIDDEDDEFDESQSLNATGTKLPCPCCLRMIEEIDMNTHLDKCLNK